MCLCVVVVSLFRLCHITRVYVGFFILTCYTLCLCPLNAVWVLCLCCRVSLNFLSFLFFPSTVFIRLAPYPSGLRLGKQKHTLQFRKAIPWKIQNFLQLYIFFLDIYVCTCSHAQVQLCLQPQTYSFYASINFMLKEVHAYMCVCCISCKINWPALIVSAVTLTAVLRDDDPSKAQGHWGQRSHPGQGIVTLETWHAENKQTF